MPGAGAEHVIAILLLWNIVCGGHSASVENRQYITRVDIPDAEDLSNERISVAMSKSWKELPSKKNYLLDVDSKEFVVNPNSREEFISSDAVSSYEQNSDTAPSSISKTKEFMRDKKAHEDEQPHSDLEATYSHNMETDKGIDEWYHENPSTLRDRNTDHNHYEHISYPLRSDAVYRTSKRSPRCLKKCLTQRLLHPAQCHSLC